jgi:hypothetical protein
MTDIARIREATERLYRKHEPCGTLTAEEDENGVVHVTREDGSLYAMMPRAVWDELVGSLDRSADSASDT